MDHVFVEETPVPGREHPFRAGTTIGREGCDIVLEDPRVSRRHAVMRVLASGPAIEDLGSTNGTLVNERRVTGVHPLAAGDAVRLGSTTWRVREVPVAAAGTEVEPAAPPAPPPPPPHAAAPPIPPPPAAPRGDVPAPPEVAPSAIRRVLRPPPPGGAPSFEPMPSRVRGSAATRVEATIVCFVIVAVTALALILYFALYEP